MKETKVWGAPIYFWVMDLWNQLGELVSSDEAMLWLKFDWLIWIKTQIVGESSFGAILCSLRMNRSIANSPR